MPGSDVGLQQIEIKDFSAGIYQGKKGMPYRPAPLGAAEGSHTYRCWGPPEGGLVPLPALLPTYTVPTPDSPAIYTIVGMQAAGPIIGSGGINGPVEELHVDVQEQFAPGVASSFAWFRMKIYATTVTGDLIYLIGGMPAVGLFTHSSFAISRMTGLTPAQIMVVKSWQDPTTANARLWYWPDPAHATTLVPITDTTASHAGELIAHQGRILVLVNSTSSHGNVTDITLTNEIINYTDPPLTPTMTAPQVMLGTENPFGYGAWGSISSGELILIKKYGGAILIEGDIFNPTVINLPGVASTGLATQKGTFSPVGLVYCCANQGVYAWNGSNASDFLSPQLDNNVNWWERNDQVFSAVYSINTTHCSWGEWVVFTHNYLFNTRTRSWWFLEDVGTLDPNIVAAGIVSRNLYAAPGTYNDGATTQIAVANPKALAKNYSWRSQIIPVTVGRFVDVRMIEIVASFTSTLAPGFPTITVSLLAADMTIASEVFFLLRQNEPVRLRLPTSCQGYNIRLDIQSDSGDTNNPGLPAPIVHSVVLWYHEGPPTSPSTVGE